MQVIPFSKLNQTNGFKSEENLAYTNVGEHGESCKNRLDHLKFGIGINTSFILAAGVGSRMKNFIDYPKCMIKVAGISLIENLLNQLFDNGITKFIINTHYKAQILEDFITSLDIYKKVPIIFSREEHRLETAGGIVNAIHHIKEDVFVTVNTDAYWFSHTPTPLNLLKSFWRNEMDQLLLMIKKEDAFGYFGNGDFNILENGLLTSEVQNKYVYTGLGLVHKRFFANVACKSLGIGDLWKSRTTTEGNLLGVYGVLYNGRWMHIGDPETLQKVTKMFEEKND